MFIFSLAAQQVTVLGKAVREISVADWNLNEIMMAVEGLLIDRRKRKQ